MNGLKKNLVSNMIEENYVFLGEPRSDDEIINTIRQLITTARDAHSNPSLIKQYQDALNWFNKKVGK